MLRCRTTPLFVLTLTVAAQAGAQESARGFVFDDRNHNGRRDHAEPGIPGVAVSNGDLVVTTNADGRYELPVTDDTIIFITKPRGWMTPTDRNGLPKFHYIHKPAGSPRLKYEGVAPTGPLPESIDFPLTSRDEPAAFNAVAFGDPQPYSIQEVHWYGHDVVTEVIGVDAKFGLSLGDLVGDDLTLMPPLNEVTGCIGLPWYHVLGNHDMNYDAAGDQHSDETFERIYGPPYYSFQYADVHFVLLDSVHWQGPRDGKDGQYHGRFGEKQLRWLRNDLRHVPRERLVVCCFHIPLPSCDESERNALLEVLADRPHQLSLAAHWHMTGQFMLNHPKAADPARRDAQSSDNGVTSADHAPHTHADGHTHSHGEPQHSAYGRHHHFVVGTASGSWWRGLPDEYGIPHTMMRDGAPNGWLLITFEGHQYKWRFKAARRPWEHQMSIHAPDSVPAQRSHDVEVVVNVFSASEDAKVELRVDAGDWKTMTAERRPDPYFVATHKRESATSQPGFRVIPKPEDCPHLWVRTLGQALTPGGHVIEIRATDRFGQVFDGRRIIRVEP